MRIWSLHPSLLDVKGLVALWREGLLAKHVLEGKTKGYKNHPQLERFKKCEKPLAMINFYLFHVYLEAEKRGYHFDLSKISYFEVNQISVTKGQVDYEYRHLLEKLMVRDKEKYEQLIKKASIIHPLFYLIDGGIESFERVE